MVFHTLYIIKIHHEFLVIWKLAKKLRFECHMADRNSKLPNFFLMAPMNFLLNCIL